MESLLKRINMFILLEDDLEKAVAFYEELGVPLVFHLPNQWAEFELGDVKIGLCSVSKSLGERRTGIVFEVENVRHVYELLRDKGVMLSEPVEKLHGLMMSVKDPGGNIIDLYQPTHEKVEELLKQAKESGQA